MAAVELHFYDADDLNGAILFQCTTDDEYVKSIELDIQRDSLGSGKVTFARKVGVALFTRQIVVPEVLVRVLIPSIHATQYIGGFFINPRQQQVISKAEDGGDGFTFAGPGPKHYLERMILWHESYTAVGGNVDAEAGLWVWPETASAGRILNRLFSEDANNPDGPFLPALTNDFTATQDSNGDPWTEDVASGADDFRLRIGDDYLKILWTMEDIASLTTLIDLGEVGTPKMLLRAFETYGRDLTGPLGADTVHWIEGINIQADLDVEGSSYRKASHALVRGNDGIYEVAVRDAWSPGELKKAVATEYESSSPTILDRAGRRFLRNQTFGEQQIDLKIITGWDPVNGLYMPGPDGTDGHFWTGDTIDLTTGMDNSTILDYQSEPQAVTGIKLELTEAVRDDTDLQAARSFEVTVSLNEERKSSRTSRDLAGNRGTVEAPPNDLQLCQPGIFEEAEPNVLLGAVCTNAGTNFDSDFPAWSGDKEERVAIALADPVEAGTSLIVIGCTVGAGEALDHEVYDEQGNTWTLDATGPSGGTSAHRRVHIYRCNVTDALAAGEYIRFAFNVGSSIAPTSESGPRCIGVYQFVGVLSAPAVGSSDSGNISGDVELPDTAPGDVVVAATAFGDGTTVTPDADWLNMIPRTFESSGFKQGVYAQYMQPSTEEEWTVQLGGSWSAISVGYDFAPSVGESNPRQGNADLVGTSKKVARCDHRHDVHRDAEPTVDDDWETAGYKVGTIWAVLDDLTTPTEILSVWVLLDDATGAAVWAAWPGGAGGGTVDIEDEGSVEGAADTIDFTGAGVSVTFSSGTATVDIPGAGGGGSGATVVATGTDIGASPLQIAVPGAIANGDLVVLAGMTVNSTPNAGGPTTSGGGAAWNTLLRFDTSTQEFQFIYWKVAASEAGNFELTHSAGSEACMALAVYRGVDTLFNQGWAPDSYIAPGILGASNGMLLTVHFAAGAGSSNLVAPAQITQDVFVQSATANKSQVLICHRDTLFEAGAGQFVAVSDGSLTFAGAQAAVFTP